MSGAARSAGFLVLCEGTDAGSRYELCDEETLIGRNPATTDITLLDANASREHAIVCFDAGRNVYVLEDLQSTNGSKVNGKRVRTADLCSGDTVEIGKTKFEFVLETARQ